MSFTKTKDRVWAAYRVIGGWLARQPAPVRKLGYGVFGLLLWIAYILPGNMVRPTFIALSRHLAVEPSRRLFADYVRRFCRGLNLLEQVRCGLTDTVDSMLRIPDEQRLQTLLRDGGAVLVFPHAHAVFPMGRGFARRYSVMALVRSTEDPMRASAEWEIYRNLDTEFLDVRSEKKATVARKVLTALKNGRMVLGVVDRIREAPPPEAPVDEATDTVRAIAFGQPVGITGWPARFARKAGVPIIPATVVQTRDTISLCIGAIIRPSDDLEATTQAWLDELERLIRKHPEEWTFALDKHWSRVLRAAADQGA